MRKFVLFALLSVIAACGLVGDGAPPPVWESWDSRPLRPLPPELMRSKGYPTGTEYSTDFSISSAPNVSVTTWSSISEAQPGGVTTRSTASAADYLEQAVEVIVQTDIDTPIGRHIDFSKGKTAIWGRVQSLYYAAEFDARERPVIVTVLLAGKSDFDALGGVTLFGADPKRNDPTTPDNVYH